jgi:nucleoside-diphosphate-sugar epimerase
MTVLFTGGSSPLGRQVLRGLLENADYTEIWSAIHQQPVAIAHPKLRSIRLRLEDEALDLREITGALDLVVHFAGITHAHYPEMYWNVNFRGTMRLAQAARAQGCRRFVYVSTRCATEGSGAYGESKLAAERALQAMEWERLLILRPAEIYGAGGTEGVDKFMSLAARFHLVPVLWGHKGLRFAPLATNDFVSAAIALIQMNRTGVEILELCGPEELSAPSLGLRIARKYRALPVPIWWPFLALVLRFLSKVGFRVVAPDQLERLTGRKTASRSTPNAILDTMRSQFLRP